MKLTCSFFLKSGSRLCINFISKLIGCKKGSGTFIDS